MLKLANQVVDVYDDIAKDGLKKIAHKMGDVRVMSFSKKAALGDTDFALCVITKKASKLNKFPISDRDSTWLSNEFFDMNSHKLPKEAAEIAAYHIKKACERHGVRTTPAVEGMAKEASSNIYYESGKMSAAPVVVRPDLEKIADVERIGDNYTVAQYAFSTPAHVKVAARYFEDSHSKMPVEVRHKYASAIQRRARELGMPAEGGTVAKYAGDSFSPDLDAHLRMRATLLEVGDPDQKVRLQKLASVKGHTMPSQFAQLLHAFDKQAKLDRYYGGYLTDPFLSTFGLAAEDPYAGYLCKTASGKTLTSEQLKSVVGTQYKQIVDYFGPHFAEEMKKDPVAIFDSLPNDAKELIAGMAN